jgi:hypothetical protein
MNHMVVHGEDFLKIAYYGGGPSLHSGAVLSDTFPLSCSAQLAA